MSRQVSVCLPAAYTGVYLRAHLRTLFGACLGLTLLVGGTSYADTAPAAATPADSAPAAATPATPAAPPRLAATLSVQHSFSALSLAPGAEPTWNPELVQSLSIDPTYQLTKKLRLTGHLGVATELTNSDVTNREREPLLEDIFVQADLPIEPLAALPRGLAGSVGLRVTLPLSKESLARERWLAIAPSFSLRRSFTLRPGVTIAPFVSARGTVYLTTAQQLMYDGPTIPGCAARPGTCDEFDHAGSRSARAGFTESLGANATLPHDISLTLQVFWVQSLLFSLAEVTSPEGMPIPAAGTNFRFANVYLLGGNWQATARYSLSAGMQTANPQQAPDSTYYTPFFNRYTQLYITGQVAF